MQTVEGEDISKWFRAPLVGVGVLTIAISIFIIKHPIGFEVLLLAFVMSFALLVIGIEITAKGVVGRLIVAKLPHSEKSYTLTILKIIDIGLTKQNYFYLYY